MSDKGSMVAEENPIPASFIEDGAIGTRGQKLKRPAELALPLEEDFSLADWVMRDRGGQLFKDGLPHCSNCGEAADPGQESPERHEQVRRIVRRGSNMARPDGTMAMGGDEVFIEPRHLSGALLETTMSPREWIYERDLARQAADRKMPQLVAMVQNGAAQHAAQTKELNRRGREQMLRALEADNRRREALTRRTPADQEIPTGGGRDVE